MRPGAAIIDAEMPLAIGNTPIGRVSTGTRAALIIISRAAGFKSLGRSFKRFLLWALNTMSDKSSPLTPNCFNCLNSAGET